MDRRLHQHSSAPDHDIDSVHAQAIAENGISLREAAREESDPEQREQMELAFAIAEAVAHAGGKAYIVGGYVRDEALRRSGAAARPKDIDLEVYGIPFDQLNTLLGQFGTVNSVGEQFQVFKVHGLDISIPRKDSKKAAGHKGFDVQGDPAMSIEDATKRRDFTINAMLMDPRTGEIIDVHGGLYDLEHKVLRAVDAQTFAEDPLRVLRAMQFAGRFGFTIAPETIELCRTIDLKELPAERIGEEWVKLLAKAERPSLGLEAARELGVLDQLHPEFAALKGVEQDPEWHPEGDVWEHTKRAVDAAAQIVRRDSIEEQEKLIVMLGALCHDLGKAQTSDEKDGRRIAHGHAEHGVSIAERFIRNLKVNDTIAQKVGKLVASHMFWFTVENPTDAALRRLAVRLHPATMHELMNIAEADIRGGRADDEEISRVFAIMERSRQLHIGDAKPKALVRGRDLIAIGMQPGKNLGDMLDRLYEAQLEGSITTTEQGVEMARREPPVNM